MAEVSESLPTEHEEVPHHGANVGRDPTPEYDDFVPVVLRVPKKKSKKSNK